MYATAERGKPFLTVIIEVERARRPNFLPHSTPSPNRGRSSTRRFRSPSPYRRSPRHNKQARALVDSGASFSVISDKYRRFLKKVLFTEAKSIQLKVLFVQ
ncbi:hypothetical protein TNCT_259371 [Trichonephila clavata]|uniref:Uncharacterized protein n=1 Tax=Trichonephila clavata TaxID=2740835 RepID=A0A8X6KYW0_TRICU|nr:hypothetical protein TNCT_259371 [Trichonephila clavata]